MYSFYKEDNDDDVHPYIKILDTEPPPRPLFARHLHSFSLAFILGGSPFLYNYATRRPLLSGIQRPIGLAAIGWMLGVLMKNYKSKVASERDAVLRHYIQLHPEDFPVPERKKYAEVLLPWSAKR